jgi:hypothetical protein
VHAFERRREGHRRGVDGEMRGINPAELARIGMDVDQRLLRCRNIEECIGLARHLGQASADQQDEIGFLDAREQLRVHAETEIADVGRMVGGKQHLATEGAGDRQLEALRETHEALHGNFGPAAAAKQRDRLLRTMQQLLQLRHLRETRMRLDDLIARRVGDLRHFGEHILRQGDHDRAGAAGGRHMEGAGHDFGEARRIVHFRGPFGERSEGGAIVELLERLAFAHAALDLADEENHRRGILLGDVDARRGVRRPWAAGHEADARTAGELAVGFRHHGGAAFLAAYGHVDVRVMQRIQRGQVALARNAEDVINPVQSKLIDKDLAAGAGGRCHGRLALLRGQIAKRRANALRSIKVQRSGVDVKLDALGERKRRAVIDRVGGAAHIGLPGIRA